MRNRLLILIMFVCGCMCASARATASAAADESDSVAVFHPHGYVEGLFGVQQTLGEISTFSLNNFNLQLGGGYRFTPVWGLRLTVGGWQSKAGLTLDGTYYPYRWNYVAPTLNVTASLTDAIWGYKEDRIVNWNIFAGPGINIAFNNKEAKELCDQLADMNPVFGKQAPLNRRWEGVKPYAVGQFGTNLEFRVHERVRIGVEGNINFLADSYNSKYVHNVDWYFNFLAGVKVLIGKTHDKVAKPKEEALEPAVEPTPADTVVPAVEPEPEPTPAPADSTVSVGEADELPEVTPDQQIYNIFFQINSKEVRGSEREKVKALVDLLQNSDIHVSLYGYADKKTGTPAVNKRIAKMRVDEVTRILINEYHISAARISAFVLGDAEQPFEENDLNRVVICIADEVK